MSRSLWLLAWGLLLTTLEVHAEQHLVVGVQDFEEYLPYSEYSDGEYRGFNRDLLDLFAKRHGYQLQYSPLPVKRLIRDFLHGRVDLKYPDNPYWGGDIKQGYEITYSEPVIEYTDGVMVTPLRKSQDGDQLRYLGLVLGYVPAPYQEKIAAGEIEVVLDSTLKSLLKRTVVGNLDGVYINIEVAEHLLESADLPELVFDPSLPHVNSTRHLSSINHPQVVEQFNRFLQEERESIEALKHKHHLIR